MVDLSLTLASASARPSLLVGVDEGDHTLVVGIIDFMRLYQATELLETMWKRSVGGVCRMALPPACRRVRGGDASLISRALLCSSQSKSRHFATPAGTRVDPTVVPPPQYRDRFREAMRSYFVRVPDRHMCITDKRPHQRPVLPERAENIEQLGTTTVSPQQEKK